MDQRSICAHIGGRIRLYRKNKNMTSKELAEKIHKSTSAMSKYEKGEVAIDVVTLHEIANVLKIDISQLVDFENDNEATSGAGSIFKRGFFSSGSNYYSYFASGKKLEICKNILEFHPNDMSVVFYNRLTDYSNKYDCRHLYHGSISISDTYIHMVMQNQINNTEKLYLVIFNPFSKQDIAYGILSGISSRNMMPVSYKVAISRHPLPENEDLRDKLRFTKNELRDMRMHNCFSIDLSRD